MDSNVFLLFFGKIHVRMRRGRKKKKNMEIFDGNKSSEGENGKSEPRFFGLYRYSFLNRDPSILFPPLHQPNCSI